MVEIAVIWVIVVALVAIAGLAVRHFWHGANPGGRRQRHGFSGGTMLVPGRSPFGHRDWGLPRAQPGAYRTKLPKFRNLKQLSRPSLRPGDVDAWAARKGIPARSDALRLLVGMALSADKRTQKQPH
jgi:hypothetical protein